MLSGQGEVLINTILSCKCDFFVRLTTASMCGFVNKQSP